MATEINQTPEQREEELQSQVVPQQTSNTPPVAQNDTYTATSGQALTVDVASGVLTNDTDAEGSNLSATVVDNPDSGSYTFNSDGSFTYTSLDGFSGTESFSYTVSDGT